MRGFSAFPGGNGNPHWLLSQFLLRLATHHWWSSPSQMTWLPSGQFSKSGQSFIVWGRLKANHLPEPDHRGILRTRAGADIAIKAEISLAATLR